MTGPDPDQRRSFSSRTPSNDNPDQVDYRRGFVTRHQVTGWRFVMRRIASGVALHDTRMLVDPLRTQSRAVLTGALVLATGLIGCFVFSLIRPGGVAGNNAVLADRSTAALYVRVGEQLHPVLNLTSARLIAGKADNPTTVKTSEIDKYPRGNLLGIPGAPERMVQSASADADWTVCDSNSGDNAGVTLIAGAPVSGGERAQALTADQAVLVHHSGGPTPGDWLLWGGKRSPIDLADRAVTDALGFGAEIPAPRPIAAGLFNAIPEAPALTAPAIAGAGAPAQFPLSAPAPVGAVVTAAEADNTIRYYAVLSDGLQPISPVLASILRNTDSFGLQQPPRLGADEVARTPVARGLDTAAYPAGPLTLVSASAAPVTCAQWSKPSGATESRLAVLSGAALPLPEGLHSVGLVGAGANGAASRVALAPGRGYLVQTVGAEPGSPTAGSLFWVSDTGVRYGIDTNGDDKTLAALGLNASALPVPWSILTQFAAGPTLSRGDALIAHDALSPNADAARLEATR
ncbi:MULTISPECIES: type VII secretion protein EccB [unclassified Mycolicibacterium]|uniref:type VII secretion protein EccB n=1 Tax=unclassified Mycolicibacterium TaxID=2636767 RepID=UPI0012DE9917|nr:MULTISPECIES: type VII secretion protein EccB [unclassified Mycolicibacterium]MUL82100.1 type VII secretion protein EccB [Mycolicibacterium sp. CBMA 329]MUL87866.1 type VII secretion protein EccB [Mycolicibacterium sp. CBMA 331]MUM01689.1 type VII secretion protein EccB [Mycolicibacterium sp. CBMA 334]MUM28424.1 type VII secretion protein EccB [Mycolicibacterium sp. CBMA 295]MUM38163.1 type VII secretion protein EccB [Mycolicibacterium sp. CBMA 247]